MAEVTLRGEVFQTRPKVAQMALLRFAKRISRAASGTDAGQVAQEQMAGIYELLQAVIPAEDWQRFEDHALEIEADDDELGQVIADALEAIQVRPTQRPSDSSAGPPTVNMSLPGDSSSAVTLRERQGRPDLALVHDMAERSRASA